MLEYIIITKTICSICDFKKVEETGGPEENCRSVARSLTKDIA
jgi:hypothetical protein